MTREPLIQEFMTQQPQSIDAGERLEKARTLMSEAKIRHLVVTRHGQLAGILSERELTLASEMEEAGNHRLLVIDACSENPYVVSPDTPLRTVAETMARRHYGSAIVSDFGVPVGIFTTVDACRALAGLLEKDYVGANRETLRRLGRPDREG